jgi:hypothetical protein
VRRLRSRAVCPSVVAVDADFSVLGWLPGRGFPFENPGNRPIRRSPGHDEFSSGLDRDALLELALRTAMDAMGPSADA